MSSLKKVSVNKDLRSEKCIICGELASSNEVHSPKDKQSWMVLYNAAVCRNFEPIKKLQAISDETLAKIKFHRTCRANFTNIKTLRRLEAEASSSETSESARSSGQPQKRMKRTVTETESVYPKKCIFCDKECKYKKGSKTREMLTQVVELRTDERLRKIAIEKSDQKLIAITSRDIVAAEACYHKSCYISYTRLRPDKHKIIDEYGEAEKSAYRKLHDFIREDMFLNPRVEAQSCLLLKLLEYLKEEVEEIKESTKKIFGYNIKKEFGSTLRFSTIDGRVYISPINLTYDLLLQNYVRTKIMLQNHLSAKESNNLIPEAAKKIKADVKSIDYAQVWPPLPHELHMNYVVIPPSLQLFLQNLIGDSSPRMSRVIWSLAQDIIYAISKGAVLTPKHVLLAMTAKTLTGNVQIISILNRLGHGCSYSKLLEIDTALCLEKLNAVGEGEIPLPSSIHTGISTAVAYDNIDRTEETLSGAGTSHRVNGIIIQKPSSTCLPPRSGTTSMLKKRRSISTSVPFIQEYMVGKRKSPPAILTSLLPNECVNNFKEARRNNFLWIISRHHNAGNQHVSSWTGFNITIRDNVAVQRDTVAYLPCINNPATEMSTVHEILKQCVQIKSQLELKKIILVLDQAIFAKAVEIAWCHEAAFSDVFIMMGGFHTICNILSIIGKLYGDAGLSDLAVEIGAISQGSIRSVLQGKQYNRAVRLHKYIYEVLMRIIWRQFLDHLKVVAPEFFSKIGTLNELVQQFCDNMCNETLKSTKEDSFMISIMERFESYLCYLKKDNGPLSSFWMMYIDLVELLLGLIRSNREGNWLLFMSCIQQMIPWCFAMDKINYARYLSVNFAQISNLEENEPEISEYFKDGGFSVQLGSQNPFSRIPIDQTLEETVNKDTQTAGGTKGFSLKAGAVERYYVTAEYRASAIRQLRENLDIVGQGMVYHADLHGPRIKLDEECVSSGVELLESDWTNPFDENPSDITNLSTGRSAPPDVQTSLLNVRKKGEDAYAEFKKARLEKGQGFFEPIKKNNIKTFSDIKTKKQLGMNKDLVLKADRKLFASMILIAENRRLDMFEVFSHPLGPLPWSLANSDGSMRKTNKAALGKHLESLIPPEDENITSSATVIDGMALIQKIHGESKTFDELSDVILNQVLNTGFHSNRIDVVFDTYKKKSIKFAEHLERGSEGGISFNSIRSGHKIIKWRCLLQSGDSKNKLTKFLVDSWQEENRRQKLRCKSLYVTNFDKCIKITASDVQEMEHLSSSQEEADTRMMLHVKDAATEYLNVVCVSDDTDVLVLSLYICSQISHDSKLYIKRGHRGRVRLIDIKKLASVVGSHVVSALPGLHSWTGCDTISAFSGQGKLRALKLLKASNEFISLFANFGSQFGVSNNDHCLIQKFTTQLYSRNTKIENINELRYQIFRSRQGQVESAQLPPCEDCLHQHSERANYQVAIWKRCLENYPQIPEPEDHGWMLDKDGMICIKWMTGTPAPEAVLELLSCSCTKSCQLPSCTCVINKLKCTEACKLRDCNNRNELQEIQEEQEVIFQEYFDSDDEEDFF